MRISKTIRGLLLKNIFVGSLGVWGQRFEHFLPLVVNKKHAEKAFPDAKQAFCSILDRRTFDPIEALDAIATLMNSTVCFHTGATHIV